MISIDIEFKDSTVWLDKVLGILVSFEWLTITSSEIAIDLTLLWLLTVPDPFSLKISISKNGFTIIAKSFSLFLSIERDRDQNGNFLQKLS